MKNDHIILTTILAAALLSSASCTRDCGDRNPDDNLGISMTIQTRAAQSDSEDYEVGSAWENYVNFPEGDYRIYFFTNNAADEKDNTLIAAFTSDDLSVLPMAGNSDYTRYLLEGSVSDEVAEYSELKAVVLANWGEEHYPEASMTLTPGLTTIDDICAVGVSGVPELARYDAFVDADGSAAIPSATLNIPFFGVHEYSGLKWKKGTATMLNDAVSLLRAVAKVEVVVENDYGDGVTFDSVSIVGHNAQGYCAPSGVYVQSDYDHGNWSGDFVDGLHLVNGDSNGNGINDDGAASNVMRMVRVKEADGTSKETWVGYLPEYDNTSAAVLAAETCAYIQVALYGDEGSNESRRIYFANYSGGYASAKADYDIQRNYLYRFHVTVTPFDFTVSVEVLPWVERQDDYEF